MRSMGIMVVMGALLLVIVKGAAAEEWKLANAPLYTRWAKEVSPAKVHPEYPRPQLVRSAWINLNGLWDYAVIPQEQSSPDKWDGKILVPFPVESALSGVGRRVQADQKLWYQRFLDIAPQAGQRWLLHVGASDWETTVFVNGKAAGGHRGGYDPFTIDITDKLVAEGKQDLQIAVANPTDGSFQPRGKQIQRPHGIW